MSRIGSSPIVLPEGVSVSLDAASRVVTAKGKKGELTAPLPPMVDLAVGEDGVRFTPLNDSGEARALWGTARALVNNMVVGVSAGFTKNLSVHGVGYRAQMQGKKLVLSLGFSHNVEMPLPEGINAEVENNTLIKLSAIDKQALGQFAAEIKRKRPPEPYKGKGVRYENEMIRQKEGKKK
ncbi:MAG: 50S ribosomal protein L6 [Proteobacteria bacterium]|nr:50S ribosomal protein L6 [Pseudomonadota bacterium]